MTSTVSNQEIQHLRRAAKKLSREQSCTHSEALDTLAKSKGYQNWSVLMTHRGPSGEDGAARAGVSLSQDSRRPATGPQFLCTRDEIGVIVQIIKRFQALVGDRLEIDRLSLLMDLEACHCNGCPIDLISLLEVSSDLDLVHDVAGVMRHLDRETGKLQDCFLPRYAMCFGKGLSS